jgi:dipeptidyl-peptidase-4
VRSLKVSPDGARVTFLRGRDDNQFRPVGIQPQGQEHAPPGRLQDPGGRKPVRRREGAPRASARPFKGILNYSWSPDGKRLLVPIAGNLYPSMWQPDAARWSPGQCARSENFAARPLRVFVRDQNLFVIELASGKEKQLTTDGKDTIHNGEAEFVAQEEMGQTTGYYWAPDDSAIAYKRYDEARCRSHAALKSTPTAPT